MPMSCLPPITAVVVPNVVPLIVTLTGTRLPPNASSTSSGTSTARAGPMSTIVVFHRCVVPVAIAGTLSAGSGDRGQRHVVVEVAAGRLVRPAHELAAAAEVVALDRP